MDTCSWKHIRDVVVVFIVFLERSSNGQGELSLVHGVRSSTNGHLFHRNVSPWQLGSLTPIQ